MGACCSPQSKKQPSQNGAHNNDRQRHPNPIPIQKHRNSQSSKDGKQAPESPLSPMRHSSRPFTFYFISSSNVISIGTDIYEALPTALASNLLGTPQIFLPNKQIFLAGGYKEKEDMIVLKRKCFTISPSSGEIAEKADLPFPARHGELMFYRNKIFYAGGIKDPEQEGEALSPLPLLQYDITDDVWQIIDLQPASDQDLIDPTTLRSPGAFIANGMLYYIGGVYKSKVGEIVFNKDIYQVDLKTLKYRKCKCKMLKQLLSPRCVVIKSDQVIITGGEDPIKDKPSKRTYIYKIDETLETMRSAPIAINSLSATKYAPPYAIFAEFPDLLLFNIETKEWEIQEGILASVPVEASPVNDNRV